MGVATTEKEKTAVIRFPGSPEAGERIVLTDKDSTVRDILAQARSVQLGKHVLSIRDPRNGKPRVLEEDEKIWPLIKEPDQEILAEEVQNVA